MVVELWESMQGNQNVPLLREALFERLRIACTKRFTPELMDVSGLWDLNENKIEELLYLLVFGVLEVKYDLDRTGKKIDKSGKKYMHWNVPPDALPGSATIGLLGVTAVCKLQNLVFIKCVLSCRHSMIQLANYS